MSLSDMHPIDTLFHDPIIISALNTVCVKLIACARVGLYHEAVFKSYRTLYRTIWSHRML